ncbi:MAG: LOG family protein [Alphaproteobacteria bacterium]|nr:LOG family protein [Alphaproteobacteria bacterium]
MKKTLFLLSFFIFSTPALSAIENIAVIGSSNKNFNSTYSKNVSQLASHLVSQKKNIVCAGTGMGLAGTFLKTAYNKKGNVTAVSYQEQDETNCPKNHPCQTMDMTTVQNFAGQADIFIRDSEALIFLPGGFDVMYVFNYFETLVQNKKQPYKPVVFLNTNHYWDRMNEMLIEMRRQNILSKEMLDAIAFENKPNNVLKTIEKLQKNIEKNLRNEK